MHYPSSPDRPKQQVPRLLNTSLTFPILEKKLQSSWSTSALLSTLKNVAVALGCLLVAFAIISIQQCNYCSTALLQQQQLIEGQQDWIHRRQPDGYQSSRSSSCHSQHHSKSSSSSSSSPADRLQAAQYSRKAADGQQLQSTWRRPVLLLIGDSLTEWGAVDEGGWAAKLTTAYRRKADVLNRGFSGYNTRAILLALCEMTDMCDRQQVLYATVWLGANDAALLGRRDAEAHVPLATFQSNLINITQQLWAAGVAHVVLMTPPPVWEAAPEAVRPGEGLPARVYNETIKYAEAVRAAATEAAAAAAGASKQSVVLLDVWQLFVSQQGWQQKLLLNDGLHLSKAGQRVVFEGLMQLLEKQWPQDMPEALPWHHPTWRGIYDDAERLFSDEQAAFEKEFDDPACCELV